MQKEIKKRAQIYGIVAALLAIVVGSLCYNFGVPVEFQSPAPPSPTVLSTFSSYEELRNFLMANSKTQGVFPFYGPFDIQILSPGGQLALEGPVLTAPGFKSEYSTTNVQVAGVDEADIVKTDGKYIYLVSNNTIFILRAYPPKEADVLSVITFNDTYPIGIFVSSDSGKLAVLGSEYSTPPWRYWYFYDVKTSICVYDISNKTNPVLTRNFMISGSYFNSRMIGEYVYAVISQPAYLISDTVILPKIYSDGQIKEMEASQIYYSNVSDSYYAFTTVIALNMLRDEEEPNNMTIMMGGTSNMYMSLNNIYITFPEPDSQTSIYRIYIENRTLRCEAQGKVLGHELNQFSMDEHNGYFRIATTTWTNGTNVYVLNMNLSIVGKLENLARGESFHSARFAGNRCFLVTFKKVDPLFVIDLSEPTTPTVLGELKIPGYSDYLHPYDENHIIGIGKETVAAEEEYFAWYQGVKISLFDVSNVTDPKQVANYTIGDRGTDSPILTDHKAFLFDQQKNLLVIPVLVAEVNETQYPDGVPPYVQGTPIWQGAYVFNITLIDGLVLRGNITHQENGISVYDGYYWVKRTLYIENVLYTVSDMIVKLNSLEDLTLIKEIELG